MEVMIHVPYVHCHPQSNKQKSCLYPYVGWNSRNPLVEIIPVNCTEERKNCSELLIEWHISLMKAQICHFIINIWRSYGEAFTDDKSVAFSHLSHNEVICSAELYCLERWRKCLDSGVLLSIEYLKGGDVGVRSGSWTSPFELHSSKV